MVEDVIVRIAFIIMAILLLSVSAGIAISCLADFKREREPLALLIAFPAMAASIALSIMLLILLGVIPP